MGLANNIEVVGVEGVVRALNLIQNQMYINVHENRDLKAKAGKPLLSELKRTSPVGETGNLKDSLKVLKKIRSRDAFIGADYKKGPHFHLVEYGFRHYKDKKRKEGWEGIGFFRRAYDQTNEIVKSELIRLVKIEFDKIGRKLEVK